MPRCPDYVAGAADLRATRPRSLRHRCAPDLVPAATWYAEFGAATLREAAWKAPLGWGFLTADSTQLTRETRQQTLAGRGRYTYSTLGSAVAGQAVAAAADLSYPDLMRTQLFEPLGMTNTAIEVDRPLVQGGTSQTGLPPSRGSWTPTRPAPPPSPPPGTSPSSPLHF